MCPGGGTHLGYEPIAVFYVFGEIQRVLDPPPKFGIDTNLHFHIFKKKGHPPPDLVLIPTGNFAFLYIHGPAPPSRYKPSIHEIVKTDHNEYPAFSRNKYYRKLLLIKKE